MFIKAVIRTLLKESSRLTWSAWLHMNIPFESARVWSLLLGIMGKNVSFKKS
jgi:hypothetical protein